MRYFLVTMLTLLLCRSMKSQETSVVSGQVVNSRTLEPIENAMVTLEGGQITGKTTPLGFFEISINKTESLVLNISAPDFVSKRIPMFLENQRVDLGKILLEKDIAVEKPIT